MAGRIPIPFRSKRRVANLSRSANAVRPQTAVRPTSAKYRSVVLMLIVTSSIGVCTARLVQLQLLQQLLDLRHVESARVVRRVVVDLRNLRLALDEVLVVVEVARIRRDAVVAAEILGALEARGVDAIVGQTGARASARRAGRTSGR